MFAEDITEGESIHIINKAISNSKTLFVRIISLMDIKTFLGELVGDGEIGLGCDGNG